MTFLGHPRMCDEGVGGFRLAASNVLGSGRNLRSEPEKVSVVDLYSVSCTGPADRDLVSVAHADFPGRNACSLGLVRIVAETR